MKILLVEDHEALGEIMLEMIQSLGHPAERAASRAAAEKALASDSFDLMITDYSLPDGTGVDLARYARSLTKPVKCMLLSAYDAETLNIDPDIFDRILIKPLQGDDLSSMLKSAS